ncbi:uncharacterized protein LOC129583343 isoform X1 [Paramacrobiotus metropolitanus]|uniref:uncharacterized protein LOC129583343 isoform X1 n=1 Tax=Paramacrobiotus metropolitanus TaxID=2943436 RepID=UPI002445EC1B|nr:uncharacterized protein LOC129583343 isoform X1 [Paramacrobiotus metropolitanus]
MCMMVTNNIPYLVEWIEFHHLQGADHFVLYNFLGTDLVEYLPLFYEHRRNLKVRVFPARFYTAMNMTKHEATNLAMVDCFVRYRHQSQWILLTSPGHFVYSTQYRNIREYFERLRIDSAGYAVKIPIVKFGLLKDCSRFRAWLSPNPYTGSVDLLYEPTSLNSTDTFYPLVIAASSFRFPYADLDGTDSYNHYLEKQNHEENSNPEEKEYTTIISGKRYCDKSNMSRCLFPQPGHPNVISAERKDLRADEQSCTSTGLLKLRNNVDRTLSKDQPGSDKKLPAFFDSVKVSRFAAPVRQSIMELKPKLVKIKSYISRIHVLSYGAILHESPLLPGRGKWKLCLCHDQKRAASHPGMDRIPPHPRCRSFYFL